MWVFYFCTLSRETTQDKTQDNSEKEKKKSVISDFLRFHAKYGINCKELHMLHILLGNNGCNFQNLRPSTHMT